MVEKLYKGKKIKWGIAGCGRFAENSFLPAIRLTRRSSVTALYSRDISHAKSLSEKFGIQNSFNNFDDFLKSDIDAVFVASSNAHHYQQVLQSAKAGKNILCEKPLSINLRPSRRNGKSL